MWDIYPLGRLSCDRNPVDWLNPTHFLQITSCVFSWGNLSASGTVNEKLHRRSAKTWSAVLTGIRSHQEDLGNHLADLVCSFSFKTFFAIHRRSTSSSSCFLLYQRINQYLLIYGGCFLWGSHGSWHPLYSLFNRCKGEPLLETILALDDKCVTLCKSAIIDDFELLGQLLAIKAIFSKTTLDAWKV